MRAIITPTSISGSINASKSKSDMQRACAASLLHVGTTFIHEPGNSNDDVAALDVIQKLGATITIKGDEIEINSNGVQPVNDEINCGESGLGIRMFTPIAALSDRKLTMNGSGSLLKRPMDFFDQIFPSLEISTSSNNGKLPIEIKGPLKPATINIDGSLSSQFLTGLLMAYSASNASNVVINVNNLKSKPYIDMTLNVLKSFGMKMPVVSNYENFSFMDSHPVKSNDPIHYTIEGDWSGAAFLFVAGAISGRVIIKGMKADSHQADKKILEAIKDSGASLEFSDGNYIVSPSKLHAFNFDATECPDLFPPLVALAAYCEGTTEILGANRLTHKESNRALTLQDTFGKMGVQIDLDGDKMLVHGGGKLSTANVHSHHDHRIAMAAAVAALGADGKITIDDAEAINKSYPDFYQHMISLGADIILETN
jgi:3-phosphoshikimate 1-carboxyvinyltransferase